MNLTIVIPDDKIQLVVEAICSTQGYQVIYGGEPNPETRAQFAKRMIIEYIKSMVRLHERRVAEQNYVPTPIDMT